MRTKIALMLLSLVLLTSAGCGIFSKKYLKTETVNQKISTTGKTKLVIDNVNGSITISRSKDSNMVNLKATKEVKVQKKFLNTPLDEIEIKFDTVSSILRITTELTKNEDQGIFRVDIHKEQRVDYEVQIPSNLEVELQNINGNIISNDLNNDLKIDLVNGEVSLYKYSGSLNCDMTNGSFSAEIDSTRGLQIQTVNGKITLTLNNNINANLRAETVNGKISDDNLRFRNVSKDKKQFRAKLGNEDSNIDIKTETVNGNIKLLGKNDI